MWKAPKLHLFIVFIVVVTIGLLTVDHFGISWDERMEVEMVQWNWDFVTQGKPYPVHLIQYYGVLFNGIAELVFRIQELIKGWVGARSLTSDKLLLAKIYSKHWVTFAWSLMSYGAVAGIISSFYGRAYGWVAPLLLALFPRFWAHSFFNPKDIPFATLFTLTTWAGIDFVDSFLEVKLNRRQLLIKAGGFGVLVGLLCSLRLGGIVFLGFVPVTYGILKLGQRIRIREIAASLGYYSLTVSACLATIFVCYPAAWKRPFPWLWEGLRALSDYPLEFVNLFAGQNIPSTEMPRTYIPQWFLVTTPLVFIVLFGVGVVLSIVQYRHVSQRQKITVILVTLQVFALPLVAILKRSTLYDEIRHFLFTVPGVVVFSAIALIWIYQHLARLPLKIGFIVAVAIVFAQIVQDMVILHPYQYTYFNRISGGLVAAQNQYETEYWGLSLRQVARWVRRQVPENGRILLMGPHEIFVLFKRPDLRFVEYKFQKPNSSNPLAQFQPVPDLSVYFPPGETKEFYTVAMRRYGWHDTFFQCPVVHEVQRQTVALARIRRCSQSLVAPKVKPAN